jgi:hypothetical protein
MGKGTAYAVSVGTNPYRIPETKEPHFPPDALEFTFVIKEQHDNRFSGTSTAGTANETLIGAISLDGKSGLVLDDGGEYLFKIKDIDTLLLQAPKGLVEGVVVLHLEKSQK